MIEPPTGTFMAKARGGCIQFPPPVRTWCEMEGWTLFRMEPHNADQLRIIPVMPSENVDVTNSLCSSLQPDGVLWVPEELRRLVSLSEQSVMMRVEDGAINVYLRKVFETLGFRPV
jgi:hypothetical protein